MELYVCLLGTGGMLPLPNRRLTALFVRHGGQSLLIDCGEGTQTALRAQRLSPARIEAILLTHTHADHVAGLPGLLLTMGNCERTKPVRVIGPVGTRRVLEAARVIAPDVTFAIECEEITKPQERLALCGCQVEAFAAEHRVPCYGYSICVPRAGRFDADRARALGIDKRLWGRLQSGETVRDGNKIYVPDAVLGPARRGIKLTYCTDTRPSKRVEEGAKGADLLILEGMYGKGGMEEKAQKKLHMTMQEAAGIAARAHAKELWLTHFSPAETDPQVYQDELRRIFANAFVGQDGMHTELSFRQGE